MNIRLFVSSVFKWLIVLLSFEENINFKETYKLQYKTGQKESTNNTNNNDEDIDGDEGETILFKRAKSFNSLSR